MPDTFVTRREPRTNPDAQAEPALRLAMVARSDGFRLAAPVLSFWVQLRGTSQVVAKEGRFRLGKGDWITFERDSMPEIRAGRTGLTLGLMLSPDLMYGILDSSDRGLLPGRGRMSIAERRITTRLWRRCAQSRPDASAEVRQLKPLLQNLQMVQHEFGPMLDRCPGRSFRRKARIFARIQKARMYLEGNPQRMLRIDELMELTRFSSWWLSKTFHAVYLETLQRASMRVRMERARDLLETSSLSISELGEACGFHDPCSFARQFKAWHGQTASAWRLQHQAPLPRFAARTPVFAAAMRRAGT